MDGFDTGFSSSSTAGEQLRSLTAGETTTVQRLENRLLWFSLGAVSPVLIR
jgi:hypothetical protein